MTGMSQMSETTNFTGGKIIKEMVVPGLFGHKDIYIRHHNFWDRGETVMLITYTNEEITGEEIEIVRGKAIKMLDGRD